MHFVQSDKARRIKAVTDFAPNLLETAIRGACVPYTCPRHHPDVLGAGFVLNIIETFHSDSGRD